MLPHSLSRPRITGRLKNSLLFLCLLAPSVWILAKIPPLWRDADAYVQLTQDPRVSTFWGHAPAYCYLVKIPLFAGEQWERLRGQIPVQRIISTQPAVTDTGIWLVVITQHLGLAVAAFLFITTVTQLFWMRLALAVFWGSNALFYTFAHCLGSETLGLILVVLLAWKAVQLVQRRREPGWKEWYAYAIILLLCILARDLNLGLVALLPAAFLIALISRRLFKRHDAEASCSLRHAIIAIAIGIACLFTARSVASGLARHTRLHPHSHLGYTFLWRLDSLADLSPEARTELFRRVSTRASSAPVRSLIALFEQMHIERGDLADPRPFMERAIPLFGGPFHWEDLDRGLNQMAFAFLWPPTPEIVSAARADFLGGMHIPTTVISEYLFATTAYYFQHQSEMPACRDLVTFRGADRNEIAQLPFEHRYFQLWQRVDYQQALLVWVAALLVYIFAARRSRAEARAIAALGLALPGAGLLLFATSCVLHNYEPRLSLSMWELLFLSLFLFTGKTADCLFLSHDVATRQSIDAERESAGQP